jgi:hypothetical protein
VTPKFSKQQGISFIPLDFDQQAYYIDNTRMMLDLLIEFAENSNDTVVKHWCSQWKDGFEKIQKQQLCSCAVEPSSIGQADNKVEF